MSRQSDWGPASNRIISIPIREGVTVNICDIPHDLTPKEARKLAAVVEAYAAPPLLAADLDEKGEG